MSASNAGDIGTGLRGGLPRHLWRGLSLLDTMVGRLIVLAPWLLVAAGAAFTSVMSRASINEALNLSRRYQCAIANFDNAQLPFQRELIHVAAANAQQL